MKKPQRSSHDAHVQKLLLSLKEIRETTGWRHTADTAAADDDESPGTERDDRLSCWDASGGEEKITKRSIPEQGRLCWHLRVTLM